MHPKRRRKPDLGAAQDDRGSEEPSQRGGGAAEIGLHNVAIAVVECGVELVQCSEHRGEVSDDLGGAGLGDGDLGATAVRFVGDADHVPAGGEPVDDAGGGGGADPELSCQVGRSHRGIEQQLEGLQLGVAECSPPGDGRADAAGDVQQLAQRLEAAGLQGGVGESGVVLGGPGRRT